MIQQFANLHITPGSTFPTQYSQELPEALKFNSRVRKLSHMHIYNFKSFKDQHYVGPFLQFTSVIGPNGSGKSSVLEAIMFCLGAERLKGRYFDIKDFVHRREEGGGRRGGNNNGNNDGGSPLCYVECTFELQNGTEVVIKREITNNNGDTRYQINYVEVDAALYTIFINSLGILVSCCNFGIWQGETEKLITKEPKQLCKHFEELSGSINYKQEYQVTKSKIDEINREIQDVTTKMNKLKIERKNLKTVKASAEQYSKYEEKYRVLQEKEALSKLLMKEIDKRELQSRIEEQQQKEEKEIRKINEKKAKVQRDFKAAQEIKAQIWKKQEQLEQLNRKLGSFTGGNAGLYAQELKEIKEQLETDNKHLFSLQQQLKLLEEKMPSQADSQIIEEYSAKYAQWEKENYLLKCEIDKKHATLAGLDRLIDSKQNLIGSLKSKVASKPTQIARQKQLEDSIQEMDRQIEKSKAELGKLTEQIILSEKSYVSKIHELDEVQRKIGEAEEKLLQGVESKKDKELCRKLMSVRGFMGMLSEKVKPTVAKYAICFYQLMNPIKKYLLVDTEQSSHLVAEKLREMCQAKNVVILANVKQPDRDAHSNLSRELGRKGILASETVDFDQELEGLGAFIQSFLQGKVVCGNLDEAMKLKEARIRGVKQIYTLDGEIIRSDGMISSSGEIDPKKLTFKFDAETQKKADKELAQLKTQQQKLADEAATLKAKSSNQPLTKKTEEVSLLEKKRDELKQELSIVKSAKTASKPTQDIGFLESELAQLKRKKEKHLQSTRKLEQMMAESSVFKGFVQKYKVSLHDLFGETDVSSIEHKLKLKNSYLSQKQQIEDEIAKIQSKNLKEEIQKRERVLAEMTSQDARREVESQIKNIEKELLDLKKDLKGLTLTLDATFKSELPELRQKMNIFISQHREFLHHINLDYSLNIGLDPDFSLILTPMKTNIDNVTKEKIEEYQERVTEQIAKVKEELGKYTSFDVLAGASADGLEGIEGKIQALEKRLEEAVTNRSGMNEILKQISEKRKQTLMDFINRLKPVVAEVYKQLTMTADSNIYGTAQLFLENEQVPFDNGLYYSPTPPAKRFIYDIDHLSGGEKSMACLALQYSIAIVTQSPILVFDETDAFLDDENVNKFLRLITKGAEKRVMQHIVISHKHQLFSKSNSLVGVAKVDLSSNAYSLLLDSADSIH